MHPTTPLVIAYQSLDDMNQFVRVKPSSGETCTVVVHLDPVQSSYLTATVGPNPANTVDIEVSLIKVPTSTNPITTSITGYWSATGVPNPVVCDATNQNFFSIPVIIAMSRHQGLLSWYQRPTWLWVEPGRFTGLQGAFSPSGPFMNVGKGSSFTVPVYMGSYFFQQTIRPGGDVSGTVTDDSGKVQSGLSVNLIYGGTPSTTATDGTFYVAGLLWGQNLVTFANSITFIDAGTGKNRTETAAAEVVVPAEVPYGSMQVKVVVQIFPPPPACNCSPWCAIGFGTINGSQTPVYYSGGANPPYNAPPTCDIPLVTVTPPNGPPFAISSGSGRHQNSGPNPASGTWTVTTVVCGQTKTATITVP